MTGYLKYSVIFLKKIIPKPLLHREIDISQYEGKEKKR